MATSTVCAPGTRALPSRGGPPSRDIREHWPKLRTAPGAIVAAEPRTTPGGRPGYETLDAFELPSEDAWAASRRDSPWASRRPVGSSIANRSASSAGLAIVCSGQSRLNTTPRASVSSDVGADARAFVAGAGHDADLRKRWAAARVVAPDPGLRCRATTERLGASCGLGRRALVDTWNVRPSVSQMPCLDSAGGDLHQLWQGAPRRVLVLSLLRCAASAFGPRGERGTQGRERPFLRSGRLHRPLRQRRPGGRACTHPPVSPAPAQRDPALRRHG
jgi:hypothetical protein